MGKFSSLTIPGSVQSHVKCCFLCYMAFWKLHFTSDSACQLTLAVSWPHSFHRGKWLRIYLRLCSWHRGTTPQPYYNEKDMFPHTELLLKNLLCEKSFHHKGISRDHSHMVYINEAQGQMICETLCLCYRREGEVDVQFPYDWRQQFGQYSNIQGIPSPHYTLLSPALHHLHIKIQSRIPAGDVDYPSYACITTYVNWPGKCMAANMRSRCFTTCYWWIVLEIHVNTFAHISEILSYLLMSSPAQQTHCYWLSEDQRGTASRFALKASEVNKIIKFSQIIVKTILLIWTHSLFGQ